jgi:hypothetical protein
MSTKRKLQIDVKGPTDYRGAIIEMVLSVDGRDCTIYTSRSNYEALIFDGFFIRDGMKKDSAGIVNTTNVYVEQ